MKDRDHEGVKVLAEGRFLRLVERRGWELVDRPGIEAIVAVVALTERDELILIEQYREPVSGSVIELPAGLVGDEDAKESLDSAAQRELVEETGFRAGSFELLTVGPPSAGQSSEVVSILRAHEVRRCGQGGGVGDEQITVHLVPRSEVSSWLARRERSGQLIDPKVWAALYFLGESKDSSPDEGLAFRGGRAPGA